MKLTAATVRKLKLPPGKDDAVFFDDDIGGFGLRVRASGYRSFVFQYQIGDRTRRLTLGSAGKLDIGRARSMAKDAYAKIRLGCDPAAEKRASPLRNLEQRVASKALAFLKQGLEPACYLYRHYHPNGDLLYVGISLVPLNRQERHARSANWRNLICRILIEPFATHEEALAAEELAIRSEFPKFNCCPQPASPSTPRACRSIYGLKARRASARSALRQPK